MKDPFLTLNVRKDPFVTLGGRDPFVGWAMLENFPPIGPFAHPTR
jgi:hypothetical protein